MKVSDFDFSLPQHLVAERPLQKRDRSRLLVLHRDGTIEHKRFTDLPSYLEAGDMLLLNNTKVFPARLKGVKENGDPMEILLIEKIGDAWEILSKGKYTGILKFSEDIEAEIYHGRRARFGASRNVMEIAGRLGTMPLPPYIKRQPDELDRETYQAVFASREGSIAAPTASLHFTEDLLDKIRRKGVIVRELTLHIGIGTFKPVRAENVEDHVMDSEYFELDKEIVNEVGAVKARGRRIFAVGTTTTRAIEGFVSGNCRATSTNGRLRGTTDLFIYPGYSFKAIDCLLTNFHLPRSTPLMLATALCSRENIQRAYKEAKEKQYRFLSYGDAMLIL
ncbi:MAG: tRNA preQ1(34) S-adenosylmethionine ribosyltransferase-isomerase QueA [Nitrospirota bacterium]